MRTLWAGPGKTGATGSRKGQATESLLELSEGARPYQHLDYRILSEQPQEIKTVAFGDLHGVTNLTGADSQRQIYSH